MSQKPLRSSSQELKNGLNTKEALPIYARSRHQRTVPAAARTVKVSSDVSELALHDVTPKGTTRSESYLVTKLRQGKETSPLKPSNNNNNSMTKSAFGSTITQVDSGGGKVRAKSTTKDHEDARVATPASRRQLNSGREFEKRKVSIEPPPPNVKTLTRSKSDSRLVSNYSERSVSPEPWSRSQTGGKTGENTLPRSNNKHTTSGRVVVVREKQQQAAVDKSRFPHSTNMELVVGTAAVTKLNANDDNNDDPGKLESAAELLYKGSANQMDSPILERIPISELVVVMSPPFSLLDNCRPKVVKTLPTEKKLLLGHQDKQDKEEEATLWCMLQDSTTTPCTKSYLMESYRGGNCKVTGSAAASLIGQNSAAATTAYGVPKQEVCGKDHYHHHSL
jgi:hypothetical protein